MSLPNGWAEAHDASGKVFYIDHINKTTSWTHPGFVTPAPAPMQADLGGAQFWGLEAESEDIRRLMIEFREADKQLITNTLSVTGDMENAAAALQAMGFTRRQTKPASHARRKPQQPQQPEHEYPTFDIFAESRRTPPPEVNLFERPDETALAALADFELPNFGTSATAATPSTDVSSDFASETVPEPLPLPTSATTSRARTASASATSVAMTSQPTVPSYSSHFASRSTGPARPSGLSQYLASTSRPHQQPRSTTLLPGGRQSLAKGPAIAAKGPSLGVGPRVRCQGPSRARGPNPAFRMASSSFVTSQPTIATATL
eukprot:m.483496 g.483496  ORF g.483496 m.483496 type:complete len:318 (+) comp22969_c0_seq1:181-1134(+)